MVIRAATLVVLASCLSACRAPALEIDVGLALESLCANHDAGACSALARLHEAGSHSSAWYDRESWPRRLQASVKAGDPQLAIHFYGQACREGSASDCVRRDQLALAARAKAAPIAPPD